MKQDYIEAPRPRRGKGDRWPLRLAGMAAAALLLVALGAAMPHLKRNHWIGVRTKWSLQSDAVWAKSQRFGGRAFMAAGVLSLLSLFLPSPWTALVFIASTAAAAVASLLYSQREGRREKQSP